jgi:hypothetical protein
VQLHHGLHAVPDRPDQERAESGKTVPTPEDLPVCRRADPGPLVEQARAVLGTKIVSAWGMTENGAVTLIQLNDPTSAPSPPTAARCPAWS